MAATAAEIHGPAVAGATRRRQPAFAPKALEQFRRVPDLAERPIGDAARLGVRQRMGRVA